MNISEEAIEAAAKKLYWMGPSAQKVEWEDVGDCIHRHYRYFARAALEAAAPHLMTQSLGTYTPKSFDCECTEACEHYRSAGVGE